MRQLERFSYPMQKPLPGSGFQLAHRSVRLSERRIFQARFVALRRQDLAVSMRESSWRGSASPNFRPVERIGS